MNAAQRKQAGVILTRAIRECVETLGLYVAEDAGINPVLENEYLELEAQFIALLERSGHDDPDEETEALE